MRALQRNNPLSPWESTHVEYLEAPPATPLEVFEDDSRSILSKNASPDVPFRFSVNAYRGCYHGCAYCYARPTHEYLGFGSGTDFERKIVVKRRAPELLRRELTRSAWQREVIVFSGNTDCYQPLEATYRLTRGCLEVCDDLSNPVHIITKAPLVERDADVLCRLAARGLVGVTLSIPVWDTDTARLLEPGVATPERRMVTVQRLADAGVPVSVNVSPFIPGLTERDLGKILEAAARAGARSAGMGMLRLPGNVRDVFEGRLRQGMPLAAERVLARTREMRGGQLNDARFGHRMRGEGEYAAAVAALFARTAARLGLGARWDRAGVAPGEPGGAVPVGGAAQGEARPGALRPSSRSGPRSVSGTGENAPKPRRGQPPGQLSLFRSS